MQSNADHRRNTNRRSGVTWIDVAVTIFVLLVLAALLLPAMGTNRHVYRRIECQNNMKQLLTAIMNHGAKKDGALPWLLVENNEGIVSNWFIDLLPELDNAAVRREWDARSYKERARFEISLKMLQCPSDPASFQVDGGLSYVVNSGYGHFQVAPQTGAVYEIIPHGQNTIDWDGDGEVTPDDRLISIATGVFWPKNQGDTLRSNFDYISSGDGQANTLLFAESLNAGKWNTAKTLDIAFVAGVDRIQFDGDDSAIQRLSLSGANLGPYGVAGGNIPRHTPSPSSNHLGTSIYGFADGAARIISDTIDPTVYLRLMTPNGHRFGQTNDALENY